MRAWAIIFLLLLSALSEIFLGRVFSPDIIFFRVLRLILGFSAGFGLSVVGAVLQRVYRNPIADGYILGISGGAVLGVALSELFKLNLPLYLPSLLFSLPVSAIIIFLSSRVEPWILPVIGVGLGTFFSSLAVMFFILAGIESSRTLYALWGSLGRFFSPSDLPILLFILISTLSLSLVLFLKNRDIDVMALGELEALCLGYDPKSITVFSTVVSSILVSIITSYVGIIGFVGIMAPHILGVFGIREGFRFYLFSGIMGASLVLLADSFGRLIFGIDPPVGVIMGIMGAPFLVYLLLRKVNSTL